MLDKFHTLRFIRLRSEIDSITDSLEKYLDFVNSGIVYEKKKHKEFLDEAIKISEEDEAQFLLMFYGEETRNIDREFPRRVFSSFITLWYSTYEETLLSICKYFNLN